MLVSTRPPEARLNIGFVTATDPMSYSSWSGIHRSMAMALHRQGSAVHCLGPVASLIGTAFRGFNKASYLLAGRRYDHLHSRILSRRYAHLFERKMRGKPLDLLFAPAASTEIAYLNTSLPVIYTSDTTFRLLKDYYPSFANFWGCSAREGDSVEAAAIRKASLLLYPSHWAAESALRDYQADERKVHVVPYGANLEELPSRDAALRPRSTDVCRLLFVGVEWARKGGDIAVDTLTALQSMGVPAELTVCGCVPPVPLKMAGLRVIPFLDKNNPDQRRKLADLYLESHFLLLPTRYECYGIVFCEANAFGLPAAGTDTGGVSEIIRPGLNGFCFPPSARGGEYAAWIAEVWRDPDRYQRMAIAARKEFDERLNWDAWAAAVGKLVQRII